MSKFELNGMVYMQNDKGNRFFRVDENGKKVRISEEEFTNAFDIYWDEDGRKENENRKAKAAAADKAAEDAFNNKSGNKVKSTRKSKDVAWTHEDVSLTAKQVDFIKHIPDTCFYENGLDSTPWCDVLADEIGGQFSGKPMTVGAMISTLREKKLIYVCMDHVNGKKAKYFGFTDLGKIVAKELGLE